LPNASARRVHSFPTRRSSDLVREVPAVFELVEKAYDLYQWTGDDRYVIDVELWKYYTKAVTDFVGLHDKIIPNGVAEGTGMGIRSEEHTAELQSRENLVCRLL